MASFVIRKIDESLWRRVKSKAALEGISLKDLVLGLIEAYAKEPARKR
jgi:predicted HicB family RNase H-like nuclease